jgi:hypothetical protein
MTELNWNSQELMFITRERTRADLFTLPEWQYLEKDSCGNPLVWENHYCCPQCNYTWTSDWSCQCNDECPTCNIEIEPEQSLWIGPDDPKQISLWDMTPDHE